MLAFIAFKLTFTKALNSRQVFQRSRIRSTFSGAFFGVQISFNLVGVHVSLHVSLHVTARRSTRDCTTVYTLAFTVSRGQAKPAGFHVKFWSLQTRFLDSSKMSDSINIFWRFFSTTSSRRPLRWPYETTSSVFLVSKSNFWSWSFDCC